MLVGWLVGVIKFFFYYESKFKIVLQEFTRIVFTKNPNLKKKKKRKKKLGEWGWGGGWGAGGRWMDRRTDQNQFAPSTSSKLGS